MAQRFFKRRVFRRAFRYIRFRICISDVLINYDYENVNLGRDILPNTKQQRAGNAAAGFYIGRPLSVWRPDGGHKKKYTRAESCPQFRRKRTARNPRRPNSRTR